MPNKVRNNIPLHCGLFKAQLYFHLFVYLSACTSSCLPIYLQIQPSTHTPTLI